jgi:CheY-like chemotaxis protein
MARHCILVVEDDDLLRDVVVEALEGTNYTVLWASDGPHAMEMIAAHEIDVIFSDVSMPKGISGIDLAFSVLDRKPHIRFILASGYSKAQLPKMPGGVSFIPKPYRIGQLLELLKRSDAVRL